MRFFVIWNFAIYGLGWFTGLIPFFWKGIAATWELGNSWAPMHWLAGFYVFLLAIPFLVSIEELNRRRK